MATPQQQEDLFREGRLILAIDAYRQGQFEALQPATIMYNMPQTTARRRIAGIPLKRGSIALNHHLTPAQKKVLKQWILLINQYNMPLRIATI